MPIYAYKCAACGYAKDALQKISDAPLTVCPQCGQPTLHKQLTAAGFQLKGTGWYVTDFRGGSSSSSCPSPDKDGKTPSSTQSCEGCPAKDQASPPSSSGDAALPASPPALACGGAPSSQ